MRKLRLDVEALAVESFAADVEMQRETVHAHDESNFSLCVGKVLASCYANCMTDALYPTCGNERSWCVPTCDNSPCVSDDTCTDCYTWCGCTRGECPTDGHC